MHRLLSKICLFYWYIFHVWKRNARFVFTYVYSWTVILLELAMFLHIFCIILLAECFIECYTIFIFQYSYIIITCLLAIQVLPSIREKHDEFMLRELVKRWANHKVMVRWLSRFFHYLDRSFIPRRSLPPLKDVGLTCFRDLVRHG